MTPSQSRALFAGLSAELRAMMETVEGLSGLVAEHAWQAPPERRHQVLVQAQAVDNLNQTLDSLRALAGALSTGAPVEDALASIPLAALAVRLQAAALSAPPEVEPASRPGDLLLFG